jgi:hypothetical protein
VARVWGENGLEKNGCDVMLEDEKWKEKTVQLVEVITAHIYK